MVLYILGDIGRGGEGLNVSASKGQCLRNTTFLTSVSVLKNTSCKLRRECEVGHVKFSANDMNLVLDCTKHSVRSKGLTQ